jgi:hypothetical protein
MRHNDVFMFSKEETKQILHDQFQQIQVGRLKEAALAVLRCLMVEAPGLPLPQKEFLDRYYGGDANALAQTIIRLKALLAKHYSGAGASQPVTVEITPGDYCAVVKPREHRVAKPPRRSIVLQAGQQYYHYHLTLNRERVPVWIFKKIMFHVDEETGGLTGVASILPTLGAPPEGHPYTVKVSVDGPHLLIHIRRVGSESDVALEVYPHADTSQLPTLYGARINQTWNGITFASSIAILSTQPRPGITSEGPVEDAAIAANLQAEWDRHERTHPLIVLLPLYEGALSKRTPPGTDSALKPFLRKPLHHYHLTRDKKKQFWSHQVLRFEGTESARRISATAPILPHAGAVVDDYLYSFQAHMDGDHLVMEVHQSNGTADMGIGVFAHVGAGLDPHRWPLCGVRIINTFGNTVVSTISILSDNELVRAGDGEPITDASRMEELQTIWDNSEEIERLPLAAPHPRSGVTIDQSWNEHRVVEILQDTPLDAEIKIFVTFFVTDLDLFALLRRLLIRSKRKITIMMLSPDAPVLEMRYGTEASPIRDTLTAAGARARIVSQLRDLAKVRNAVNKFAADATRDNRPADTGTLEVRLYSCAPTLVSYQTPHTILVGMLLLHESANAGPMIEIKKGEPMWNLIENNWDTVFRVSTPMDWEGIGRL